MSSFKESNKPKISNNKSKKIMKETTIKAPKTKKTTSNEYSELTIRITEELSKDVKKAHGIFITPRTLITILGDRVLQLYPPNNLQFIIEPSCGTCEFIRYLDSKLNNTTIHAVELNQTIFSQIEESSSSFTNNNVSLFNRDFLEFYPPEGVLYDLCIGNPPYVVLKKEDVPSRFSNYSVGRPNLFGLFIIHSLSLLKSNGILAFVVPNSFLNSAYYSKIRSHIKSSCNILDIIDFKETNLFIDTAQDTFGLIIQKREEDLSPSICNFSYRTFNDWVFTSNSIRLQQILDGSTTLLKMGCFVKTGNVVWNQHKERLTTNETDTILLYNSNLGCSQTIELKNFQEISNNKKSKTDTIEEKAQYINLDGSTIERKKGCAIIVNRGNGNSKYKLNYALVPEDFPYYVAENHLNVIDICCDDQSVKLDIFSKIIKSFQDPRTTQFIDMFLGNNGLSKTELETIFPIYL